MHMQIAWKVGVFSPGLKEQAEEHGVVLENVEIAQRILYGVVVAHARGVITDAEYNRILKRFFSKIVEPNLRLKEGCEDDGR